MPQITLHISTERFRQFRDAHEQLTTWLGFAPSVEWLMAFTLETANPVVSVETAREMSKDYLLNRIDLHQDHVVGPCLPREEQPHV